MTRPRPRRWLALALLLTGCRSGDDGRGVEEERASPAPCTNADVPSPPDVKGACPSNGSLGEAATDAEMYRVFLTNSVDGCGIPSWKQHDVEPPVPLVVTYGGSGARGILGSTTSPARMGGFVLGTEDLNGKWDGNSLSLAGTITMVDGVGCQIDWRVSLTGWLTFDGLEGEVTYHVESGNSICDMRADCTVLQLVSGVRVSYGSNGDPVPDPDDNRPNE